MKKPLSPVVVVVAVALLVGALAFGFWKQGGGGQTGRMKTDLGAMEQDPEKLKKGMEELLQKEQAGKK